MHWNPAVPYTSVRATKNGDRRLAPRLDRNSLVHKGLGLSQDEPHGIGGRLDAGQVAAGVLAMHGSAGPRKMHEVSDARKEARRG